MPDGTGDQARRPLRQVGAYVDPIALVGIALSVVVSVALDLTNAASGVESFLACLMGITIALVLDANARAERRFRMRNMIEATPWLGEVLVPLVASTSDIERQYPATPITAELRVRYARLGDQLDELRRGRVVRPRGDYEYLLASTRTCRHTLHAVTNVVAALPARGLSWWVGDIGRHYWQANLDALNNGVRINRVFIYTRMTVELDKLLAEQELAGVQVGRLLADSIDPALRLNLAIWDASSAWEARLNAGGEIIGNVFTINKGDLDRLNEAFKACEMAADFTVSKRPASSP